MLKISKSWSLPVPGQSQGIITIRAPVGTKNTFNMAVHLFNPKADISCEEDMIPDEHMEGR